MTKRSLAAATTSDPRWLAVEARDAQSDGKFYYSVKTTGVYCQPSCPSRRARPENVAFHSSVEDAERAGFRPCKRCKPERLSLAQQHAVTISELCDFIEKAERKPTLNELSTRSGMSSYHLHRVFKRITGLTPKAYANATRAKRIRQELSHSETVTAAIYSAGYTASGRFYSESDEVLGMMPNKYRGGGRNATIHFAVGECSLGSILVAQSDRGVCAIFMGDEPDVLVRDLQDQFPHANLVGGDHNFEQTVAAVVGFVEAPGLGLDLPLDVRGTAFQQRVWQALGKTGVGKTVSYTDIANRLGVPKSARAVAQACAANTLAVAIPCHRVVRRDGGLSGYRWGVERKRALLEREANS